MESIRGIVVGLQTVEGAVSIRKDINEGGREGQYQKLADT